MGRSLAPDASVGPDAHKVFGVARAVRNLGDGQYVGALVTDTEFRRITTGWWPPTSR